MIRACLVDDEAPLVEWMASHLRNERPELSLATFTDPRAALDSIKRRCPDILITDLLMPGLSGLDLIVAAREASPALPVIVTTGHGSDQLKSELRHSTSVQVLEKPFELQKLSEAVNRSVEVRSGFSGAIDLPMLPDLIQLCALSRVTGRLGIQGARSRGDIYMEEGAVVHAVCGQLVGAEALYQILGWVGGRFSMEKDVPAPQRSIDASWQELMLEGYRRLDEAGESAEPGPASPPPVDHRTDVVLRRLTSSASNLERELSERRFSALREMSPRISGFSGAAIFDQGTGAVAARLGVSSSERPFPDSSTLDALRKHTLALKAVGASSHLEDIIVTLSNEIQFLTAIDSTGVLFVSADRDLTNVAILRSVAAGCAETLRKEVPRP